VEVDRVRLNDSHARLAGRVALVTGAAHGIGLAISRRLALEGAAVVLNDVDRTGLAKSVADIRELGGRAASAAGDVRRPEDTDEITAVCEREFGGLHILVNTAGLLRPAPVHEMTDEQWDSVVEVVLRGAFNTIRSAARLLMIQGPDPAFNRKVVTISSVAGVHGVAGSVNYSAAKAGVIGLSKALAREWAPLHINVNVVAPGRIVGTMIHASRDEDHRPQTLADRPQSPMPIGRLGHPDDVASLVAYLVSPDSDYMTAQVLELHGGMESVPRR
jgi:3-oxoacyl-[acyl-carrier protein] reductase